MGLLEHPIRVSSLSSQCSFVRLRGFEFRLKFCSVGLMSSSSQSSRFRSPYDNFYPPPACHAGWLDFLCSISADERQCIWWMSSSYSVIWMRFSWETSKRDSSGGRRKTEGRLCALRKLARLVWRWCSCVRFVLVGASFLGAFFHFLRSWRRLHLIEGFYLNFLGGDLVRIRFFLWCKQQSPPGDPAPPRLVETLVTEGCRKNLQYDILFFFRWSSIVVDSFIRSFILSMWFRV